MEQRSAHSRAPLAAFALLIFGASILVHLDVLRGWWLSDDPQVLVQAMRYSPLAILFDPPSWRYLSSSSFTPLVTLSFDLDLALAGLRPAFFYAHQLIAIATASVLFFLLLARGGRVSAAALGAATFIVLPATFSAAGSLMIRHYVEGLVLSLLALLLWPSAKLDLGTRDLSLRTVGSAVFYLLAMLAKEFYAPLPLLMIAIDRMRQRPPRRTLVRLLPSAISALAYILWRTHMIGSGGGYGTAITSADVLALPATLWTAITGPMPHSAQIVVAVAMAALGIAAALRKPRAALVLILAAGVFAIIPLIVLAGTFEMRYAFVSSVLLIGVVTLAAETTGRWSTPLMALIFVIVLLAGWRQRNIHQFESRAIVAEGRYIWRKPPQAPPLLASAPGWYLEGLRWIRMHQGRGPSPFFVLSTDAFLFSELSPSRTVTSEWGTGRIVRISPSVADAVQRTRSKFAASAPLNVEIVRKGNDLSWRLGPANGTFTFLNHPRYSRYAIPAVGFRRIPQAEEQQYFRIRRDAADGSWTVSPPLPLPKGDGTLHWWR